MEKFGQQTEKSRKK